MTLYHGAHTQFALHTGQCWCRDVENAECYAGRNGVVVTAEIDMSGLRVVEVEGYDRDADYAIGDRASDVVDADVIEFADEDARGRQHRTWRIMSDKALAAVKVIARSDDETDDDSDAE